MSIGSGLTRNRSAPSSYLDRFLGDDDFEQLLNPSICSPEAQDIFARFMSGGDRILDNCAQDMNHQPQSQMRKDDIDDGGDRTYVKRSRPPLQRHYSYEFSSVSQAVNWGHTAAESGVKGSAGRLLKPMGPNRPAQVKMEKHSLIRHCSSPAGLFGSINIEELGAMRGIMGNIGAGNIANKEGSFSSTSRFKSHCNLPPRTPSSPAKKAPAFSGFRNKDIGENRPNDAQFDLLNQLYGSVLSDDFLKGLVEDVEGTFSKENEDQKSLDENRAPTGLSHHLSLPKNSAKLLQDSVACKLRAKRGFATHPRSIAERMRRTKISERIRKLQDLVPNMEKPTNTADMLDLAVDYIKDLQQQIKRLSDSEARCGCSTKR